jgi:GMP synthase (glutamine-hydrolysing)
MLETVPKINHPVVKILAFFAKIRYHPTMKKTHIAILDFGSQYMHLNTRRIRQLGVLSKIYPTDVNAHELKDVCGIILSGGPNSVNDQKVPYDPGMCDLDVPILGLCYGHQLMAHHYGGVVTPAHNREYGMATLTVKDATGVFAGLEPTEQVWMSHWDSVTQVPEGFHVTGTTDDCPVAAMANPTAKRYGAQFHMEVHHTTHGMQMLRNFVFDICGAEKNWSMEEYLQDLTRDVQALVKDRNVFLLVSGGVDSSVAFALLEKILGKKRVYGLHIDNGFMRENESAMVATALAEAGFDDLHVVDASKTFLAAVEGMTDPEEKRKTIGRVFLEVQRAEFAKLGLNQDDWLLGQGTIYPDTIESGGTKTADTIKTHHNRVDEILEMINAGKVVEPLAELYKDEVRELGRQLGLSDPLVNRWPFPGPGLSIRTLCSNGKRFRVADEDSVNVQIQKTAAAYHLNGMVLPIRSVGVQGDQRSYQHPALVFGGARSV